MAQPLRILMLIPHLGVGGAQGAFLRLAEFLSVEAEVTLALMDRNTTPGLEQGFATLPLAGVGGAGGKIGRWWRMVRRLRALKREHDVVISFLSGVNLLNALSGQRHKTIVSERGSKRHDIGMTDFQRALWTRALDPLTYWRSGRVVAASAGLAHEIVTANPWAAGRVMAIEGTVRAEALVRAADFPVEPEIEQLAGFETVACFGRLHVQKGYDFLLQAFARVRAQRPRARLLLIGDGPEAARLRAAAAELGLRCGDGPEADVVFTGVRSDPLRYLKVAKLFAMPSRYEGLPNALIEAIAAGVPVLASDCCWGPRTILSQGSLGYGGAVPAYPLPLEHGVLMPVPGAPEAVAQWASEMERILSAPRLEFARADRLKAAARYDIGQTGPQWLALAAEMQKPQSGLRGAQA